MRFAEPGSNPSLRWSRPGDLSLIGAQGQAAHQAAEACRASVDPSYRRAHEEWVATMQDIPLVKIHRWRLETPLLIGLGAKGVFETGLTWLLPYGVPAVSGSSMKGLLRASMAELWGLGGTLSSRNWEPSLSIKEVKEKFSGSPDLEPLLAWMEIFGSPDGSAGLACFGLRPEHSEKMLKQDVITPHERLYHGAKKTVEGWKALVAPQGKVDPIPVGLTAVKPGLSFVSAFACSDPWLVNELTKGLEHALGRMGVGAKTSSGYGRFSPLPERATQGQAQARR